MITNLGKLQIRSYLAGLAPAVGQSISVGINPVAPTVNDTKMGFEIARTPVLSASLDPVTNKVVFKGTVPLDNSVRIAEVGLWSSMESVDSELILTFDESEETWEGDVAAFADAPTISRLGETLMNMSVTSATAKTATYYIEPTDLSHMLGPDDVWSIAFNKTGAAALTVKVKLSSASGSMEFNFYPSNTTATGYLFANALGKSATVAGTFDPTQIERFDIIVTPASGNATASTVQLDGLVATNAPSERTGSVLVARSLITPVFTALATTPTDVEYELEVVL